MIYQILGYLIVAVTLIAGLGAGAYLTVIGQRPWTWQRKVHSPKLAAQPYYSDDYSVGNV